MHRNLTPNMKHQTLQVQIYYQEPKEGKTQTKTGVC
jgi:hypothetical protein